MKLVALLVLIACTILTAGPRISVEKVIRPDTLMVVKHDTTYQVRYDTIRISKTYNDTSLFVKADSSILSGKPILLKKK
jgi:hypothetical protein